MSIALAPRPTRGLNLHDLSIFGKPKLTCINKLYQQSVYTLTDRSACTHKREPTSPVGDLSDLSCELKFHFSVIFRVRGKASYPEEYGLPSTMFEVSMLFGSEF